MLRSRISLPALIKNIGLTYLLIPFQYARDLIFVKTKKEYLLTFN